ncbi:hypothetical protein QVD17_24998 [Tagetes erecta]|uniref:RING-type E3 ubiquitin transferase n=1 Tax=Tagetes erecta TaxID=13708 RepID=A0AAD8KJ76_TARER|nr:hypothetical protein QVD17_24998 [Tagetes erecta]
MSSSFHTMVNGNEKIDVDACEQSIIQINTEPPESMASSTTAIATNVSTVPMARFSIGEDDDESPLTIKRPRLSESASQSRRSCNRSQSRVVAEEEEEDDHPVDVEDVESDSQEDDERLEIESEEEDEDVEVCDQIESEEDVSGDGEHVSLLEQYRQQAMASSTAASLLRGLSNASVANRNVSSASPVFNNAIGELQVVLTDPDVLDCPICLDPLSTPVFQCENGHIACSLCCHKVNRKCPSCCMPIGYNRCRAIEKVIESVKTSCKNAQYGCKETMTYSKKFEHELMCLHATCFCPHPSCPFAGSSKSMYLHFGIQHAASTTRFTYNTRFFVCVSPHQKHIFLQEQHESVIFILNHQFSDHGRALSVDCVGPSALKASFEYQIIATNTESTLSLECIPEIHTRWSEHPLKKNYLTIPPDFFNNNRTMPLHLFIKKIILTV